MSTEYNLCSICGGIKDPIPVAYPRKFGICPGHEPAPKHDGELGGRNPYQVCCVIGKKTQAGGVRIGHAEVTSTEIWLSPAQALSLRDWLIQESPTLERLAKEQSGD